MRSGLALLLCVLVAASALAQPADENADPVVAGWTRRLGDEHASILAARERVGSAEHALGDARQRRRPRGKKLAALRAELAEAEADLAERETAWPDLLEQARRAGAPPALLMEYEQPAAAPAQ